MNNFDSEPIDEYVLLICSPDYCHHDWQIEKQGTKEEILSHMTNGESCREFPQDKEGNDLGWIITKVVKLKDLI